MAKTTRFHFRSRLPNNLPQENVDQIVARSHCLLRIGRAAPARLVPPNHYVAATARATLLRMRPLLQYRTPAQLLWMIGAANVLVSMSFALLGVVSRHYPHRQHRPLPTVLFSFGALVLGLIGTLIAESKLRNGIRSERWSDAVLDAPRKVVAHPAFFILPYLLIIASFVDIIFSRSGNLSGAWMFLYPAMSLTRVTSALRPRQTDADPRNRMDSSKPLRSEHWGSPPRPFST